MPIMKREQIIQKATAAYKRHNGNFALAAKQLNSSKVATLRPSKNGWTADMVRGVAFRAGVFAPSKKRAAAKTPRTPKTTSTSTRSSSKRSTTARTKTKK
jgi:hypothetical protein